MNRIRFLPAALAVVIPCIAACSQSPEQPQPQQPTAVGAQVLQHHVSGTRSGLYVDPLITPAAAATTHRDPTFNAMLPGPTYAQPLYVTNGPRSKAALIVV